MVVIIGGIGYWHFDSKYRGLDDLKAELGYNRFERSEPDNPFADLIPENNRLPEVEKRKAALAELDRRYLNRREVFSITAFIGGAIAVLVLLWNIIWHAGHWIWMGRRTNEV